MKSTNKTSKLQALKEIEQKQEYKDENINNSISEEEEENNKIGKEVEKLNTLDNNNNENPKSILKNISKNNSVQNITSKICTHNNADNASEEPDIKKPQRCVPLEIYKKVYQDKQTLINQVRKNKYRKYFIKSGKICGKIKEKN